MFCSFKKVPGNCQTSSGDGITDLFNASFKLQYLEQVYSSALRDPGVVGGHNHILYITNHIQTSLLLLFFHACLREVCSMRYIN